jgi:Fe-S oxidoreductase
MRHLGISFGVLKKEKCTGDAARRLGNDLLFEDLARQNLEAIAQTGAAQTGAAKTGAAKTRPTKMVSICPHCVRTIGVDWNAFGPAPAIEHHSEFLARHAAQLEAAASPKAAQQKVVFHDPCYLGRYRGVYDEPRQVAALAGALTEAPRAHSNSFCCGAGGGLVFLGEEKGERISHNRAAELAATGAEIVAAACPFCNTMLADALKNQPAADGAPALSPPQLLDIAQIAASRLPPESLH